ncbi:hypothetical protein ACPVPU_03170 [Sphingomonas sp. CJ99]
MNGLLLAGSLVAVLALAGIARALGLGRIAPLTAAEAGRIAGERVIGFRPGTVVLATDGNAALVMDRNGDGAVAVRRHGVGVLVATLSGPLALDRLEQGISLDSGDPRIGTLLLPPDPALLTRL